MLPGTELQRAKRNVIQRFALMASQLLVYHHMIVLWWSWGTPIRKYIGDPVELLPRVLALRNETNPTGLMETVFLGAARSIQDHLGRIVLHMLRDECSNKDDFERAWWLLLTESRFVAPSEQIHMKIIFGGLQAN